MWVLADLKQPQISSIGYFTIQLFYFLRQILTFLILLSLLIEFYIKLAGAKDDFNNDTSNQGFTPAEVQTKAATCTDSPDISETTQSPADVCLHMIFYISEISIYSS